MFHKLKNAMLAGLVCVLPMTASAQVLWSGDFETGDLSQWSSKLDAQPGTTDRLVVVESPVKQGRYALKVTVKPGDLDNGGNRAEVVLRERWFYQGDDVWFHWYTQFPSNFQESSKWSLFTQWHSDNVSGVPLGFNLHGTKLSMRVMGHEYDDASNWNGGILWTEQLQKGKWMEFLVHVKWSDGNDGFIEMWKDGQLVVPKTFHRNMDANTPVYLKFGYYRDKSITYDQTIFHDGMTVFTSKPLHLFEQQNPQPDAGTGDPDPKDQDAGTPDPTDPDPTDPETDAGTPQEPDPDPDPDPTPDAGTPSEDDGGHIYPDKSNSPFAPGNPNNGSVARMGCSATSGPTFAMIALLLSVAFAAGRRRRDAR